MQNLINNRMKINVNMAARPGAISANEASSSLEIEDDHNKPSRPKTHEGFKPTAPERTGSRGRGASNVFTSPRQVTVKLVNENATIGDADDFLSSFREASDDRDFKGSEKLSPKQSWPNTSLDSSLPSFIKKSTPQSQRHNHTTGATDFVNTHAATVKTAYPTLGTRLNATIVSSRPNTAVQSNVMSANLTKSNKLYNAIPANTNNIAQFVTPTKHKHHSHHHLSRPNTANNTGAHPESSPFSTGPSIDFHAHLERSHRHRGGAATTPHQHLADPVLHYGGDVSASDLSTVFDSMEIEGIVDYLLDARQSGSRHAPFVHVTPRHFIEKTKKNNFYDLVILERPGNPKSGGYFDCIFRMSLRL
jgi:hypothetical protein